MKTNISNFLNIMDILNYDTLNIPDKIDTGSVIFYNISKSYIMDKLESNCHLFSNKYNSFENFFNIPNNIRYKIINTRHYDGASRKSEVFISSRLLDTTIFMGVMAHELAHIEQLDNGDLNIVDETDPETATVEWKSETHKVPYNGRACSTLEESVSNHIRYLNYPWEKEARKKARMFMKDYFDIDDSDIFESNMYKFFPKQYHEEIKIHL